MRCVDSNSTGHNNKYIDIRVSNLIGKGFPCRGNRYRIVADLARKGKVARGKARYLLNIVNLHLDVRIISFPVRFLNLIGKVYFW